jgi:hypothetical protein
MDGDMLKLDCTDYAADHADPDSLPVCAYCKRRFDDANEGHIDEATGLGFCDAPCEQHYAAETGLPKGYVCA